MLINHLSIRNGNNFSATMTIEQILEALGLNNNGFEPKNDGWQHPWPFPYEFQECSLYNQGILLERPLGSCDLSDVNEIIFFPASPDDVRDGKYNDFWDRYELTGEGDAGLSMSTHCHVESYGSLPSEVLARLISYCLSHDLRFALEVE